MSGAGRGRRRARPPSRTTADERGDGTSGPGPSPEVNGLLHLQRTAGNRVVQRLVGSGRPAVQRDIASDVEDKLSYGAFDWAITDAEAASALQMLAGLPQPQLAAVLGRISAEHKTRLLENLPASSRRTSGYTKVLVALGADVMPYLQSLLTYGVFDWAITDADAEEVFRVFVAVPRARRIDLAQRFGPVFRNRLMANLQRTALSGPDERAALKALFDATPDAEVPVLIGWAELRFGVRFGPSTRPGEAGMEWDADALRRMYNVLDALPDGAVLNNPNLTALERYKSGAAGAEGYYSPSRDVAAVTWGNVTDLETGAYTNTAPNGVDTLPDPLVGVNLFDATVLHEVGHAVDKRLGLAGSYCIGNAAGGDWRDHGAGAGLAATLVAGSGGAIAGLPAPQAAGVTAVLQAAIDAGDNSTIVADLQALPFWGSLGAAAGAPPAPAAVAAAQAAVLADPAVRALRTCFVSNTPWMRGDDTGGVVVGGRLYQEAYGGQWWSYDPAARGRKVSKYQFRAPGEWIAEAYTAYYSPPAKGDRLGRRDGAAKAWFDVNVDEATGGGGAADAGPALPAPATGAGFPGHDPTAP